MPLDTPPHDSTARSASTHSTTVFDMIDAVWPRSKPSAIKPWAISRTALAVWFQFQLRQTPNSF